MKIKLKPAFFCFCFCFLLSLISSKSFATLRTLYPELTDQEFQSKLSLVKDSNRFLKEFIPYYYQLISQNESTLFGGNGRGSGLFPLKGWCVGDAHFSNFGVLLGDQGVPLFTIASSNDGGACPIYADFLRLLVSIKLYDPSIDLAAFITKYREALADGEVLSSMVVKQLMANAAGKNSPSSDLFTDSSMTRLVRAEGGHGGQQNVSPAEMQELTRQSKNLFGEGPILLDALKYKGEVGWSYRLLVDLRVWQLGKQVIELQATIKPGVFPVTDPATLAMRTKDRFLKTLRLEQGSNLAALYTVITMLGADYLIRPLWKGDYVITLSDFTPLDLEKIFLDEAAVLGSIHKQAVDRATLQKYQKELSSNLTAADWALAVSHIITMIERAYRENAP